MEYLTMAKQRMRKGKTWVKIMVRYLKANADVRHDNSPILQLWPNLTYHCKITFSSPTFAKSRCQDSVLRAQNSYKSILQGGSLSKSQSRYRSSPFACFKLAWCTRFTILYFEGHQSIFTNCKWAKPWLISPEIRNQSAIPRLKIAFEWN